jgi:hypothetical protein
MSVSETSSISRVEGAWRAPGLVLRLAKPKESAASNGERREFRERRALKALKKTRCASYHFETVDGPLSTYAAQVIGQALDAHEKPSARTAYRERPLPEVARLLDRSF